MRKSLGAFSAVLVLAALTSTPRISFGQDDHEGHDHAEEGHAEHQHVEAGHEDHDEHDHAEDGHSEDEGVEDGHEGHAHDEEAEEHTDEVTLSPEAIERLGIRVEQAQRRDLAGTSTVPARVTYNTEAMAHIGTQVQGRVQRIAVRLGDEVAKGDLLLVIDSPQLGSAQSEFLQKDAAIEAARTNVEAAEAMVDVARTAFERAELLKESNGISITDFLERQGALREAEANVRRAQADLRIAESARLAAENQLHIYGYRHEECDALLASGEIDTSYEVFAPIAGQVIEREVTPGEVVDPADEALMVLADMRELWVLGDVPERHVGRVTVGTPARVTMTALSDMVFEGSVSYVAPQLDPRTRTASVRIVVPSSSPAGHREEAEQHAHHGEREETAGARLKPGMVGQAELSLSALPGRASAAVLVVPEEAIQTVEGGPAVFVPVEGEANTFAKRAVKVGPRVGKWVPILSGLSEGEEYVASQTFILKAELGKEGASHGHAH